MFDNLFCEAFLRASRLRREWFVALLVTSYRVNIFVHWNGKICCRYTHAKLYLCCTHHELILLRYHVKNSNWISPGLLLEDVLRWSLRIGARHMFSIGLPSELTLRKPKHPQFYQDTFAPLLPHSFTSADFYLERNFVTPDQSTHTLVLLFKLLEYPCTSPCLLTNWLLYIRVLYQSTRPHLLTAPVWTLAVS